MPPKSNGHNPFEDLPAFGENPDDLNAIIDTPKGSRNKYKYDPELGLFKLGGVLPAGAVFPYDFGYVPSTAGGDGDPLDVLVLMDDSAFVGCLVSARLIGVIEAEQMERDGKTERNDRLIAVASESHNHHDVRSLDQVSDSLLAEIEHFFISYNEIKGKQFKPIARHGPDRARALVEEGIEQAKKPRKAGANGRANDKSKSAAR